MAVLAAAEDGLARGGDRRPFEPPLKHSCRSSKQLAKKPWSAVALSMLLLPLCWTMDAAGAAPAWC